MQEIKIVDYNPSWAVSFAKLKVLYIDNIKDVHFTVEHVGSTAIPKLCAKPIIDIDIIIYNQMDFAKTKASLNILGYTHLGDLGIANREAFKYDGSLPLPAHHLYVCLDGILALENHIKFRDYLLENSDAVKKYGNLKRKLVKTNKNDLDKYCEDKTPFITEILLKCNINNDSISSIIDMNKS